MSQLPPRSGSTLTRLRRDLGTVESYAALIGMLVGAGIFKVAGDAYVMTGPSVILGYLVLAPAILATSVLRGVNMTAWYFKTQRLIYLELISKKHSV